MQLYQYVACDSSAILNLMARQLKVGFPAIIERNGHLRQLVMAYVDLSRGEAA
jgi:hypothetical protein